MKYISIDIERDDLNEKLGGGIPRGSLIIIEGPDGNGKSIVSQRITYGALVNGASVTYISTELSTWDFLKQMNSLNYIIDDYLFNGKLLFITLLPLYAELEEGENLIFKLEESPHLFEKDILIIDSLSYPLVSNLTYKEVKELISFFNKVKDDKIIILTYDPRSIDHKLVKELRRVADIYFKLKIGSIAGQRVRFIEIERFRNAKDTYTPIIPFRVEPKLGFVIEIVSVV